MMSVFTYMYRLANRHADKLLLAGVAAAAAYNWRVWQRDKAEALRVRDEWPPLPTLKRTPRVSVLVAAWNEHIRIGPHLQSFLALRYANIELVVCAGGTDGTLDIVKEYASERIVVLEQQPGEGKQRALARCIEHASGEIIYLTDADCLFDNETLTRLLAPIVNDGLHVVSGARRPLDEQMTRVLPRYLWASDVVSTLRSPLASQGLYGANAAMTRAALEQSGGLDFPARSGTDYQLALRVLAQGFEIRLAPHSFIPTEYAESLALYRRQQSRWLRNLLLYGRRYGARHDVAVTLKPVSIGTLMLTAPLSSTVFGPVVLVPWAALLAHASLSKLRYVLYTSIVFQQPVPARLLLSLVPLTLIDFAIWASPLYDLLKASRREIW